MIKKGIENAVSANDYKGETIFKKRSAKRWKLFRANVYRVEMRVRKFTNEVDD